MRPSTTDWLQRLISGGKRQQLRYLREIFWSIDLVQGSRVLDYGCGTALFAPAFLERGCVYWGYDIKESLIAYASEKYSAGRFSDDKADLRDAAPFDLVLANCCAHHMNDIALQEEMSFIYSILAENGRLLFVDIVSDAELPGLARLCLLLERGAYVRTSADNRAFVEGGFVVEAETNGVAHMAGWESGWNPFYWRIQHCLCTKGKTA